MSEESLFLTDNPSAVSNNNGNNNTSNITDINYTNNMNSQLYNGEFLSLTNDMENYDIGDPFNAGANMDEHFAGDFLNNNHNTNEDEQNFSLDPTSIANDFASNLMTTYESTSEHLPLTNSSVTFETTPMSKRDSPFDVSQFQLTDPLSNDHSNNHTTNHNSISGDHLSNDDNNQNSNGEEQEDSQAPRRSRATGEALALLILEFSKNINPNGAIRKQLAELTGMSERSVRIWFQNRRAKLKKMEKMHKDGVAGSDELRPYANSFSGTDSHKYNKVALVVGRKSLSNLQQQVKTPIVINENYCLVDCNSISIGTWQRIKSGYINSQILKNLINLSPKFLNSLMFTTDLLIILSKKNKELNYFFSGFFQNNKILFRIFYPLESILSCSLLNQQQAIGDAKSEPTTIDGTELRLTLSSSPKFAVFFLNNNSTGRENSNQWSICDDFSEGQQVNNAYVGEGGSDTPHVLSGGDHDALQFLNNYILQYHQQQLLLLQLLSLTTQQPNDVLEDYEDLLPNDDAPTVDSGADPDAANPSHTDDYLIERLGSVGDISGTDNLFGF